MNGLQNKLRRMCSFVAMLSLVFAALGSNAKPAVGQETVQGKFTLPTAARLGKTMLPAGEYRFLIHPVGIIQSVSAIQSSHVQVLIWGTTKGGPIVNLIAEASKQGANTPNAGALDFREETSGLAIHSMGLEEFGVVVEFDQSKTEGEMNARRAAPANGRETAKSGGK
jgi:hypothetical protein